MGSNDVGDDIDNKIEEICRAELPAVEKLKKFGDLIQETRSSADLPIVEKDKKVNHLINEIWRLDLSRTEKGKKMQEIFQRKSKMPKIKSSCCSTCSETSRRVAAKLEQLQLQEDNVEVAEEQEGGELSVDVHPCKIQLVITVNAPIDFQLSLDFVPCFQGPLVRSAWNNRVMETPGWIAGSSNGYLLCTPRKFFQTEYYVCNPVTKQWLALPPAPRTHGTVYIGFIFDPCCNYNINCQDRVYHHDPLNCDTCVFKVVRFYDEYQCHQLRSHFEVETFSSDIGHWTITTVSSPKEFRWGSDVRSQGSFFHNGCLHWLGWDGLVVYDPYLNKLLGVIRVPERSQRCRDALSIHTLGLCCGSLWLCQFSPTSEYLRFWELRGYDIDANNNINLDECYWFPYRLCNFEQMMGGPEWVRLPTSECRGVLAIHPHDPDIVYLQLMRKEVISYVVSCNLRTKTLRQPMFGYYGYRVRGDVFTLDLPVRSTQLPSTS